MKQGELRSVENVGFRFFLAFLFIALGNFAMPLFEKTGTGPVWSYFFSALFSVIAIVLLVPIFVTSKTWQKIVAVVLGLASGFQTFIAITYLWNK